MGFKVDFFENFDNVNEYVDDIIFQIFFYAQKVGTFVESGNEKSQNRRIFHA